MKTIKAYKEKFLFADSDRYNIFLKQHIFKLNPNYYIITQKKKIMTEDGMMYVIRIEKDIEVCNAEPIIECYINAKLIYLWNDCCWTIAKDKHGRKILRHNQDSAEAQALTSALGEIRFKPTTVARINKTIVIYRIGEKLASD